jgi:hypothetical protein
VPTPAAARVSDERLREEQIDTDERLREEQIDTDERLREEQTRPMSGLVSDGGSLVLTHCFDGSVLGAVVRDVRGDGPAEVFVARPSESAGAHGAWLMGGGGGPVQAGRADRRIEVGEDEGVEPIALVVGRAVATTCVRQLAGADHHDGAIGTFDGDFLDPGIGQEAQRSPQSRRAVPDGAAPLFASVRVDDQDCATPNFGAGMGVPVRSLIGVRWRSALSPADTVGDEYRGTHRGHQHRQAGSWRRQDRRYQHGAAMSACTKSRHDR